MMLVREAVAAEQAGQFALVEKLSTEILGLSPRNPGALAARAGARVRLRKYADARRDIEQAFATTNDPPADWFATLAQIHRGAADLEAARETLDRGLARHPGAEVLVSNMAEVLATLRRHDEAFALLDGAITSGATRPGILAQFGRACRNLKRPEASRPILERASRRDDLSPVGRQIILFELGQTLDAMGDYAGAFDTIARANALETKPYDAQRHAEAVDQTIAEWTRDRVRSAPKNAGAGERSIFIVGMRRSGTTLVEQVLAAQGRVRAGDELGWLRELSTPLDPEGAKRFGLVRSPKGLTRPSVERIGRDYTRRVHDHAGSADRFTDKMPANWKLLGVASLALPRARVVWVRRDPMDSCLSCYFHHFNDNSYCAKLGDLARYWHDCRRLLDHWRSVLDLQIHELVYERLVAEPEHEMHRLVEFLGLEWNEACLRFQEAGRTALTPSADQVARPLYSSSIGRWKRYEAQIAPLRSLLAELGEA